MARTKGNWVALIDAGMDIDFNELAMVVKYMEYYKADVIIGSKREPASNVEYPFCEKFIVLATQQFKFTSTIKFEIIWEKLIDTLAVFLSPSYFTLL